MRGRRIHQTNIWSTFWYQRHGCASGQPRIVTVRQTRITNGHWRDLSKRNHDGDGRAAARRALDVEPAIQLSRALAHHDQPEAAAAEPVAIEASAVVRHHEGNRAVHSRETNSDVPGAGMFRSVAECFLDDAEQRE